MKSTEVGISGPKSIPQPSSVASPFVAAVTGDAIGGTSNAVLVDFNLQSFHEGLLLLECKSVNGAGGTPTAPGAGVVVTVYLAFCNDKTIALADAPSILGSANVITAQVTLPNSIASTAQKTRVFQSDAIIHRGQYAYCWVTWAALPANAQIFLSADVIRL